ncbi:2'-5' RNA ligase family protein [Sphingomonas zeicaulis]|uniref:2'-5' RNA ligase family protein n=1 Tax=Sphingomonas zeicaulis TaxID=1632740 RepID=UPI003D1E1CF2
MPSSDPLIVTALFGDRDFAWLDGLRRQHFPRERNQVPAHLTLFHQLPPMLADEVTGLLKTMVRSHPRPPARIAAVMHLGGGVAFRVESDALAAIREDIAERFHGLLTVQDQQGWRAHVTIQNKVTGAEAKRLQVALAADFAPRPLAIAGLAAWWYRGGPWEKLSAARFR